MYIGLHVKYRLLLSDFNVTWILSTDLKKNSNIECHENPFSESRVFPSGETNGRTDWQAWRSEYSPFAILRTRAKKRKYFTRAHWPWNLITIYERKRFWISRRTILKRNDRNFTFKTATKHNLSAITTSGRYLWSKIRRHTNFSYIYIFYKILITAPASFYIISRTVK